MRRDEELKEIPCLGNKTLLQYISELPPEPETQEDGEGKESDKKSGQEEGNAAQHDSHAEEGAHSDANSVTSGHSSMPSTPKKGRKKKRVPATKAKFQKQKKKQKAAREMIRLNVVHWQYEAGDQVCAEILYTMSTIEVMWQDGGIQQNVPSIDLHPIHHLDELEFFPGDFVIKVCPLSPLISSFFFAHR